MNIAQRFLFAALLPLTAALTLSSPASAQAAYFEGFDNLGPVSAGTWGPSNLINSGWDFRNQSLPQGFGTWRALNSIWTPQQGADALMVRADSTTGGGTLSTWAVLPAVPNQIAGDALAFYVLGVMSTGDLLEVRYSPTGGTSTGSLFNQVGDFTVLLDDVDDLPLNGAWNLISHPLPGSGRIALRFFRSTVAFVNASNTLAIDSLSVGPPPPPPCNVPPIPAVGQTVTWTASGGPWEVCLDTLVPAGGTVLVEAGARIEIDAGRTLRIDGTVRSLGTPQAPVTWVGGSAASLIDVGGTARVDLYDSVVECHVRPLAPSRIDARNSLFRGLGELGGFIGNNQNRRVVMTIDECTFDGANLQHFGSVTRLTRSTFVNGAHCWLDGYTYIDETFVDGAFLNLNSLYGQPTYIDNVIVVNNINGPGLALGGGSNFFVGPNTQIQNNLVPVEFGPLNAGLLPGSVLPSSGNTENHVLSTTDLSGYGRVSWAPVGVPYIVRQFLGNGVAFSGVTLHPGSHVQIMGGYSLGEPAAEGLPDAPILIEAFDPLDRFGTIQGFGDMPRLEYCIIDGAERGVGPNQGQYQIDNCIIRNCAVGAGTGSFSTNVRARSTRFENNDIALSSPQTAFASGNNDLNGATNPNSFVGNGIGFNNCGDTDFDARANWWGAASGPNHPSQNPAGTGDSVECTFSASVDVANWRTAAPDFANHPPIVRLVDPGRSNLTPGETMIVRWDVSDDDVVVEQEVRLYEAQDSSVYSIVAGPLSGTIDTIAFTVPPPFLNSNSIPYLKVFATDSTGKEGWDEFALGVIDASGVNTTLQVDTDVSQPFLIGDQIPIEFSVVGLPGGNFNTTPYLLFDANEHVRTASGILDTHLPDISTDTARIGVLQINTLAIQKWAYSDYFTVRPDSAVGDAAPVINLLTPVNGGSYQAGSIVPIRWTASDDEALRSFDLHVSTNAGLTWHPLVRGLPGDATSWMWRLPESFTSSDLRVRVIAWDKRFQNSSDGGDRSFVVRGGTGSAFCFGDGGTTPGCTSCPCGNDTLPGSLGGCLNSTGNGARLEAVGVPSASNDTLHFALLDAPASSFAILISAANALPANGNCPPGSGITSQILDGLRCVGGGLRRHGGRPTDSNGTAGLETRGWGAPDGPAVGLVQHALLSVGETRSFQVFYREDPLAICGRGQNTTNAVSITVVP